MKLEFEQVYYDAVFTKFAKVSKPQALLESIIAWRDNLLSVHCNLSKGKRIPPREF